MSKYRKKPAEIEAILWNGYNRNEIDNFITGTSYYFSQFAIDNGTTALDVINVIVIKTLEGEMMAFPNDYIIKGVNGEYYPCKPDIFWKTYEMVED